MIETPPVDKRREATPWFTPPAPLKTQHVAVIGAGIAGCSVAAALARRGIKVSVIERTAPGAGGSGNRQGALYVKLAADTNHQSRFYLSGLLYSQRWLSQLKAPSLWQPCGVVQLATNAKEAKRQQRFSEQHALPEAVVVSPLTQGLSEAAGVTIDAQHALFYPQAGWVRPKALCEHLLQSPNITLTQGEVTSLNREHEHWQLKLADGRTINADHVVIASAHYANTFTQTAFAPLQQVRGQVSEVTLPVGVKGPERVVCAGGYVSPAFEGVLTFGASFVPNNDSTEVTDTDHQRNIEELRQTLPALVAELETALESTGAQLTPQALEGRAAVRAASPDKTPYAGPVPDASAWQSAYAVLGKDASRAPDVAGEHYPGLWISTAHGSRGLSSAPLCAEVIASRLCDDPMPLEAPLVDHLHAGRRIISAIIRGQ